MTDHTPSSSAGQPSTDATVGAPRMLDRRRFITLSAVFGVAAATPIVAARTIDRLREGETRSDPASADDLILVSVQMAGGNDGLNTVVDHTNGKYRDLRREIALDADQLDLLDDRFGLYSMPSVANQWHAGNVAIVHGLGHTGSPLSHFTATDVWNAGSVDPSEPSGWLGRALRAARGSDSTAFDGISLGDLTGSMRHPEIDSVSLPVESERLPWSPADRSDFPDTFRAIRDLSTPASADTVLAAKVRQGQGSVIRVGQQFGQLVDDLQVRTEAAAEEFESMGLSEEEIERRSSSGALDPQFDLIANLINAGIPTRAYHVKQDGYDTHEDQMYAHPLLLNGLDASLARFWEQLGANAHRVVVMTWSEFGRRPSYNGSGTDHGTASIGMVIGQAVSGGHYGEPSPLDSFDQEGNFIPTTDFRRYLGGVAGSVLGVDPNDVTGTNGDPLRVTL